MYKGSYLYLLSPFFLPLYNFRFSCCQFQVAELCYCLKKGDKTSAANYRPISLTCILCKVLEHIMASHLVKHFDKHDLLYDLQHGFREKRSCDTQLTMLFEDLARNTSVGKQTDLILLDFRRPLTKLTTQSSSGSSTSMRSEEMHYPGSEPS